MKQHRLSDRQFGLMIAAVFLVIVGVGWFLFDVFLRWASIVAGAFAVVALVLPGALMPLNRLWGAFAERLGKVVNFVLLAAFFYVVVLPVGLIVRLFGRDAMHREPDPKAKTYWATVTRHTDDDTLHDMF